MIFSNYILSIILFTSISFSQGSVYAYPFNHVDIIEYKIFIDLTKSFKEKNNGLAGDVNIKCIVDTLNLQEIYLDAVSLTIDSVYVNTFKANYNTNNNYLRITLNELHSFGDSLQIHIYYKRLAGDTPAYYFNEQSSSIPEDIGYTASYPANTRYWLPCKDSPHDKAFVETKIKVPKGVTAVSNGDFVSRIEGFDYSVFTWRDSQPMAAYVISVSASKYSFYQEKIPKYAGSHDSILTRYFYYGADSAATFNGLRSLSQIVSFYSKRFFVFPFDFLNLVIVPGLIFTAMSNQTTIQFNSFLNLNDQFILPHEVGHQWFGNFISPSELEQWMTEGLAEYARALYVDSVSGDDFYRKSVRASAKYGMSFPGSIVNGYYGKLNAVLEMLRTIAGDSLYWFAFNQYLKTFAYSSASTNDFINSINESTSGIYDWFLNEWFNGEGYPIYNVHWDSVRKNKRYKVTLSVKQEQLQRVFTMPVDITFVSESGDSTVRILNTEREQSFSFELESLPINIVFDKDSLILIKELRIGPSGVADDLSLSEFSLSQNYPNPFNPSTSIKYSVPYSSNIELKIYDILGKEIAILVNEEKPIGEYEVEFNASDLSSGVYFYTLKAGEFVQSRKLILLK